MRIRQKYRDENNIPLFFLILPNTQKKKKTRSISFLQFRLIKRPPKLLPQNDF